MPIVSNKPDFLYQIATDLEWLTHCPSLVIKDDKFIETSPVENTLSMLLDNQELVSGIFANRKHTVGDYFERLVLLWLHLQSGYGNIQQHIRIYDGRRTVGEMDFLINDIEKRISLHLEVAVKYFLLAEKDDRPQFIGPNPNDTFEKKYQKLVQQQLALPQSPFAKVALVNHQKPIVSKGILKGYLFYPSENARQQTPVISPIINMDHWKGWWTAIHRLHLPQSEENSLWIVLKKPYWFTIPKIDQAEKFSFSEMEVYLEKHFAQNPRPVFLAEVMQSKNGWQEISRGFIVNKNWPN